MISQKKWKNILPKVSYEINDIEVSLNQQTTSTNSFSLRPNNRLKCDIYNKKYSLNFCSSNGIGFSPKLLKAHHHLKKYTNLYQRYAGEKRSVLLNYAAFKIYCFFRTDYSRREDSTNSSTVYINLDIIVSEGFPAFCYIIHDSFRKYFSAVK